MSERGGEGAVGSIDEVSGKVENKSVKKGLCGTAPKNLLQNDDVIRSMCKNDWKEDFSNFLVLHSV